MKANTLGDEAFASSPLMVNYMDTNLEKAQGKKALPGEVHKWGNRSYTKMASGKWSKTEEVSAPEDNKAP